MSPGRYIFRTDASIQIGIGHVMRCLTLAHALTTQHHGKCLFICRDLPGNLAERIRAEGFECAVLPSPELSKEIEGPPAHAAWAGVTWQRDAQDTQQALGDRSFDWLIVDHYAFDMRWEKAVKPSKSKLFVVDDLADRPHVCDLLLDQTYGREPSDYRSLAPEDCRLLCGSNYALIRPEFAALRPYSLKRRAEPVFRELLITMGGVDKDNATGQVLQALRSCTLPDGCRITVVMGATAPWLHRVRKQAQNMPWPTRVLVGVSNMAKLMADSDLAIGAAGATSWERCCLGVPTIMLVLAENQRTIARALSVAGAAQLVDASILEKEPLITPKHWAPQSLSAMSNAAAEITAGFGVEQVIGTLIHKAQHANQLTV